MNGQNDFQRVLAAALQVAGGTWVAGLTVDSVAVKGMCAQAARQTVEAGTGVGAGGWVVAQEAHKERARRGGDVRWASDYAGAARRLGLGLKEPVPGCLLYWNYAWTDPATGKRYEYGHLTVYLGSYPGVKGPAMLENTNATTRAGALRPFGTVKYRGVEKLSQVFVSPVAVMGTPDFIFAPTRAALDSLTQQPPVVTPGTRQVFLSRNGADWVDVSSKRVELSGLKCTGLTINADNPAKVYIRTEE